jgi:hypothetical protein
VTTVIRSGGSTSLPTQTGHADEFLTTDGTTASWAPVVAGGATGGGDDEAFYNNDTHITTDYTIPTGSNAGTFGPVTIDPGATVTVPPGSVWTIV